MKISKLKSRFLAKTLTFSRINGVVTNSICVAVRFHNSTCVAAVLEKIVDFAVIKFNLIFVVFMKILRKFCSSS